MAVLMSGKKGERSGSFIDFATTVHAINGNGSMEMDTRSISAAGKKKTVAEGEYSTIRRTVSAWPRCRSGKSRSHSIIDAPSSRRAVYTQRERIVTETRSLSRSSFERNGTHGCNDYMTVAGSTLEPCKLLGNVYAEARPEVSKNKTANIKRDPRDAISPWLPLYGVCRHFVKSFSLFVKWRACTINASLSAS